MTQGLDGFRVVDNGVVRAHAEQMPGLPIVHAYHLVPRHRLQGTGGCPAPCRPAATAPEDCIAVGDSREDMDAATVVGTFWLVGNALERDPTLEQEVIGRPGVRIAEEGYGAGVYEAVVTTLAGG